MKLIKIADLMDFNVEEFECSDCSYRFVWGNDDEPRFCPHCGTAVTVTDLIHDGGITRVVHGEPPIHWDNLKRSAEPKKP